MVVTGVNINQSWANVIVGKDDTTYYALRQSFGAGAPTTTITTGSDYATVYAAAIAALPGLSGIIIDKTGQLTPNPKIRRYQSGVLCEETANLISDGFAIDSTGVKTVTVAHGMAITPGVEDITLTLVKYTGADDWACGYYKVESVDATNVTCKVNVTTASATGSATAKLNVKIDVR